MRQVSVKESEKFYRVCVLSDCPISSETFVRMPWSSRVVLVDRNHEGSSDFRYVFQLPKAAANMPQALVEAKYQDFFDTDELRPGTNDIDTRQLPNTASITVARLIELMEDGSAQSRKFLHELLDRWWEEHRDAVRDLEGGRSVCPDEREHFRRQEARVLRRDLFISWVETALAEDFNEARRIATEYNLV